MRAFLLLLLQALPLLYLSENSLKKAHVKVFHFTIDYWRLSVEGDQQCGSDLICEWTYSDDMNKLRNKFLNMTADRNDRDQKATTVSVYNIHSWLERQKSRGPMLCELPTSLTLAETEESRTRYHGLFDSTFKHFDGFSSTHPSSHVQRVYESAFLNETQFINNGNQHNFSTLIKAAAYVAGDCHKRDNANSNRDHVVHEIRKAGFRVEGLGRCMHTVNPEGMHF
jgi:hypothetical protein